MAVSSPSRVPRMGTYRFRRPCIRLAKKAKGATEQRENSESWEKQRRERENKEEARNRTAALVERDMSISGIPAILPRPRFYATPRWMGKRQSEARNSGELNILSGTERKPFTSYAHPHLNVVSARSRPTRHHEASCSTQFCALITSSSRPSRPALHGLQLD